MSNDEWKDFCFNYGYGIMFTLRPSELIESGKALLIADTIVVSEKDWYKILLSATGHKYLVSQYDDALKACFDHAMEKVMKSVVWKIELALK